MYTANEYVNLYDDGLEVVLCPDSAKNGRNSVVNPLNTRGLVSILGDDLAGVEWANGASNVYHFEDLLIAPEFMEGDKVRIDSGSIFATADTKQNPRCLGEIVYMEIGQTGNFNITVLWHTGRTNIYRPEDLQRADFPDLGESPFDAGELKAGDLVAISSDSEFYQENDLSNPIDIVGEVITMDAGYSEEDFNIIVEWENGLDNAYFRRDLVRLKKGKNHKPCSTKWLDLPNVKERREL